MVSVSGKVGHPALITISVAQREEARTTEPSLASTQVEEQNHPKERDGANVRTGGPRSDGSESTNVMRTVEQMEKINCMRREEHK